MKKLFIFALVLCLLTPCAFSEEDYDGLIRAFASEYNLNAQSIFAVPELPLKGYVTQPDTDFGGEIALWVDGDFIIAGEVNDYGFGYAVVTTPGSADGGEFLARCANAMYIIDGLDTRNYEKLLFSYFQVRAYGKERSTELYTGGKISLSFDDDYWTFVVASSFIVNLINNTM